MSLEPDKKDKRRAALMGIAEERGYITLTEAAEALGVSAQTIRRDMNELEKLGRVKRTHGGITFTGALDQRAWRQRQRSQTAEKKSIAERIASIVTDGATIFLDIGTTCEEVALALLARRNLKIVTYSIRSAAVFDDREDFTIAIPGGIVRHIDGAILGAGGDDFISQFSFDYAIIAVSGIDMQGRLRDDDEFEVLRVRTAIAHARKTLLALTTDKIGTGGLVKLCDLSEIDVVVANDELPDPLRNLVLAKDVELVSL